MQIYGDNSCEIPIATFTRALLASIDDQGLTSLRAALIACGQLEQLLMDADGVSEAQRGSACLATSHAAAAFYSAWSAENSLVPKGKWQIRGELQQLRSHLAALLV